MTKFNSLNVQNIHLVDINDCASTPCMNEGICVDGINSFTCNCPHGFIGKDCSISMICFMDPKLAIMYWSMQHLAKNSFDTFQTSMIVWKIHAITAEHAKMVLLRILASAQMALQDRIVKQVCYIYY